MRFGCRSGHGGASRWRSIAWLYRVLALSKRWRISSVKDRVTRATARTRTFRRPGLRALERRGHGQPRAPDRGQLAQPEREANGRKARLARPRRPLTVPQTSLAMPRKKPAVLGYEAANRRGKSE